MCIQVIQHQLDAGGFGEMVFNQVFDKEEISKVFSFFLVSVTFTIRIPALGATATNILQVPLRLYS